MIQSLRKEIVSVKAWRQSGGMFDFWTVLDHLLDHFDPCWTFWTLVFHIVTPTILFRSFWWVLVECCPQVSTISRGLTPKVIAKGKLSRRCTDIGFAMPRRTKARSLSAPPKFGIQEEQKCRDEGKSLDDSSLESLLHPVPKLATMDPRMILKRFYATLVGEGREDTVGQPVTTRAISSSSGIGSGDTWPVLCKEPRRLLESSGYVEPYDLSVADGVFGMAVPLPTSMEKTDDLGAMIAHALLSSQHWEQLKPRLWGHGILDDMEAETVQKGQEEIDFCSIDDEEARIPISVQAPDGSRWQVEVLAPLRFHLLRRLAFRNDANFCEMLRRCDPHSTTGGKSKSAFWKSQCGQLMLKEVRAAEASHLASKAGPFAVRLAEALRGEPSLLCEVFGLFKVSRLGKRPSTRTIIIMRNLLNGIDDDWQIFDIKGAAHRHMPATPTLEVPMGSPRPSSPVSVKWDDCFVETFGALPKVLKPTDHEALELALKCDLHVLRELGLVDYSLLMAFNLEAKRVRLAIIDFLQPYTLNKQQLCSSQWKSLSLERNVAFEYSWTFLEFLTVRIIFSMDFSKFTEFLLCKPPKTSSARWIPMQDASNLRLESTVKKLVQRHEPTIVEPVPLQSCGKGKSFRFLMIFCVYFCDVHIFSIIQ